MPLPYSTYVRNIEANSISEAEKLFNENFHKRKLTGVRQYSVRALKKTAG